MNDNVIELNTTGMSEALENHWSYWRCLKAVCQISSSERNAGAVEQLSRRRSWDLALQCARDHRFLPTLAASLQQSSDALNSIPVEVCEALEQARHDTVHRNMDIYAQAIHLAEVLNGGNIVPVFLKGTALLLASRGENVGRREQIDIDLVVPPSQRHVACDLLQASGYQFVPLQKNGHLDMSARRLDTAKALMVSRHHHHLPPLVHPQRPVVVELHKYQLPGEFDQETLLRDLIATSSEHRSHGVIFRTPSPENQIIQLVLGNFVHDGHASAFRVPARALDDYIAIKGSCLGHSRKIHWAKVRSACGRAFEKFDRLSHMVLDDEAEQAGSISDQLRCLIFTTRYESPGLGVSLDKWARLSYLLKTSVKSPGKIYGKMQGEFQRAQQKLS